MLYYLLSTDLDVTKLSRAYALLIEAVAIQRKGDIALVY